MSYDEVMYGFDPAKGPDKTVETTWVPLEKYQRLERALEVSTAALESVHAYMQDADWRREIARTALAEIEAILKGDG